MSASMDIVELRRLVAKLDECLSTDDIKALKFLSSDFSNRDDLQNVESVLKIVDVLESRVLSCSKDNITYRLRLFILEMLYRIGRYDLLQFFGTTHKEVVVWINDASRISLISSFRTLLFLLCENITDKELKQLKFIYCNPVDDINLANHRCFSKRRLEAVTDPFALFLLLEEADQITPGKKSLAMLEDMMNCIDREDLKLYIENYAEKIISEDTNKVESLNLCESSHLMSCQSLGKAHGLCGSAETTSIYEGFHPSYHISCNNSTLEGHSPNCHHSEEARLKSGNYLNQMQPESCKYIHEASVASGSRLSSHGERNFQNNRSDEDMSTENSIQHGLKKCTVQPPRTTSISSKPVQTIPLRSQSIPSPPKDNHELYQKTVSLTDKVGRTVIQEVSKSYLKSRQLADGITTNSGTSDAHQHEMNTGQSASEPMRRPQLVVERRPVTPRGPDSFSKSVPVKHMSVEEDEDLPFYKMDAKPRGFCVIINNVNFYQSDSNSKKLGPRQGSALDKDMLTEVFRNVLFFNVVQQNDLTDDGIRKVIHHFAEQDHSQFDCFVCCVLSHGFMGGIFGCNGKPVKFQELTKPYRSEDCPSLRGKPKMFFIQACQGKETQPSVALGSIQTDAPSDAVNLPEEDETLPNEADFLMSYATIPGYVSYRSKTHGSWYINTLVKNLKQYWRKYDLVTILTKVNEDISRATAKIESKQFKQSPAPQFTLRKLIKFK